MWPNPQETADLVTFTEEILNGKLHFLCSGTPESASGQLQNNGQWQNTSVNGTMLITINRVIKPVTLKKTSEASVFLAIS